MWLARFPRHVDRVTGDDELQEMLDIVRHCGFLLIAGI
jgi:hypothetical protein